jgi:pyridoxal phosphate enzyme (YggS family)
MTIDPERLGSALDDARTQIAEAAVRSGRPADAVQLVLAGKYVGPDAVPALLAAGVSVVGENRLQDLLAKRAVPGAEDLVFDFIGSLQRRKVRDVLAAVRLIHSVDRISVLEEVGARADGPVRVLLQVNIAGEPTKQGFIPDELDGALAAAGVAGVKIGGLMALPPFAEDPEASRPWFERVRLLRNALALKWGNEHDLRDLSMGTSQDFIVAVEAGATIVRVGRGIVDQGRMEP